MPIRGGACPRCHIGLAGFEHNGVVPLVCPSCRGLYLAGKHLQAQFGPALEVLATAKAVFEPSSEALACPIGCQTMRPHRITAPRRTVVVDVCPSCQGVWFDGGEVQAVFDAHRGQKRRSRSFAPPDVSEQRAQKELSRVSAIQDADEGRIGGGGTWLIQFLTGIPIEGYNPVHRAPVVTWSLIVVCCFVLFLEMQAGDEFVMAYSLVPASFFAGEGIVRRLIGSMFLHGGLGHLLGNMYFLKIFGDNVEDRLGRVRFLVFYAGCGVAAGLAQAFSDPASTIPVLGASGAIGGVLAAYTVLFPDARVQIAPSILTLFRQLQIRAMFYFPWWFLWQFISLFVFKISGVAWWAHIGGFVAGFFGAMLLKNGEDPRLEAVAVRIRNEGQ
ncbi:MAG: rhomboid family intramembrane serine protease [Deltaproteobacteria bacterium]|nr:rhomboid family intramembrane serine protease [Deltaproteobacteria bacterium]